MENSLRIRPIFILLVIFLGVTACAQKKAVIGRTIDCGGTYCCRCDALPARCSVGGENDLLIFEYSVEKADPENHYRISGFIDCTKGKLKSWSHLMPQDCHFAFILARHGRVVDYISFSPRGHSFIGKLPFEKRFQSALFDAICITGNVSVRG